MHELGLSEGLLATVIGVAGDRPVTRVRVSIGALQRVVPDSLEFGFRLVAEGTVCETARLEVAHLPVRVRCMACGVESRTDEEPVCMPLSDLEERELASDTHIANKRRVTRQLSWAYISWFQ